MDNTWQLQAAKNRLSEVVDKALNEGHQIITRHGIPQVVVVSMDDFRKMHRKRGSLVEFLKNSPMAGLDLDLTRDKTPVREMQL
jgi:prevent-host-death family protein